MHTVPPGARAGQTTCAQRPTDPAPAPDTFAARFPLTDRLEEVEQHVYALMGHVARLSNIALEQTSTPIVTLESAHELCESYSASALAGFAALLDALGDVRHVANEQGVK